MQYHPKGFFLVNTDLIFFVLVYQLSNVIISFFYFSEQQFYSKAKQGTKRTGTGTKSTRTSKSQKKQSKHNSPNKTPAQKDHRTGRSQSNKRHPTTAQPKRENPAEEHQVKGSIGQNHPTPTWPTDQHKHLKIWNVIISFVELLIDYYIR